MLYIKLYNLKSFLPFYWEETQYTLLIASKKHVSRSSSVSLHSPFLRYINPLHLMSATRLYKERFTCCKLILTRTVTRARIPAITKTRARTLPKNIDIILNVFRYPANKQKCCKFLIISHVFTKFTNK